MRAGSQSMAAQALAAADCRATLAGWVCVLVAVLPVARNKFTHAVEDRTGRAEAESRQHGEPGQHTEHVAVGGQHRILDHVAHDLAARQFAGIDLLPLRQQFARGGLIAGVQRVADIGEMMAELPEPQRHVQHGHAPKHREGPSERERQQPVHARGSGRRNDHCHASRQPSHGAACPRRSSCWPSAPSCAAPHGSGCAAPAAAPARGAERTGWRRSSCGNDKGTAAPIATAAQCDWPTQAARKR